MIVVTGGLGFIGNELVRQCRKAGHELLIIDNKNRVAPSLEDLAGIPVEEADITDAPRMEAILKAARPSCVFHLAAIHYIPECNQNPERTLRVNVEGTSGILRAAAAAGAARVVFASSGAVYADSGAPLHEDSAIAPVDIYGWSKLFGEQLCRLHHDQHEQPVVVARLFNNYGPRETNPHIIPEIINQLRSGNSLRLGNITTVRDYVHTQDCAQALIRLSRLSQNGLQTVNVANGTGYTVRQVIDLISEITGRSIEVSAEAARFRKFDKQVQVADVGKLEQLTGWRPSKPLAQGMKALLEFEGLK